MADPFSLQTHHTRGNENDDDDALNRRALSSAAPTHYQPPQQEQYYYGQPQGRDYADSDYQTYEYSESGSRAHYGGPGTESPTSDYGQFFSAATNGGFPLAPNNAHAFPQPPLQHDAAQQQQQPVPGSPYSMRNLGSDATALDTSMLAAAGAAGAASYSRQMSSEKPGDPLLLAAEEAAGKSPVLYKKRRQRRRCCGNGRYCFCFSRRCCLIFIPILILILAGLGVTLYYVWPRIPEVTFNQVGVAQPNNAAPGVKDTTTVSDLVDSATINRKGVVTVPLVLHLNVTNPNYIPWTIHNVTISGYLRNSTQGASDFPVGEGGLRVPFYMPKQSVGNDMPIYFNFRLDTNNTSYLSAAQTVQAACTANGPDLRFYYRAQVILHAISWLGIKPTISNTIQFACPISQITGLGIQISDLTGLNPAGVAGT
ncbi:hypothetical protein GGI02_002711 [Coemansia sp. RSA 2322]|uniref:Uncharacterized protein n=1 Tax=Coemansia thaxteri TaxID=2663907 RepID=A0A9W8BBT5_9FUNG|nr:hypothetical protein H4R26_003094 [Coemansia thaxteri]KAJ2470764.1 hypothetical protein GGI02_002711 [Coemansia sp. RSA 2322]KAJ2483608.1 hypothetical protein EV174_002899 [Coemansia sp. RSA 2320]